MFKKGRNAKTNSSGENNGRAIFTESDIKEIREMYNTGKYTQQYIGDLRGVPQVTISAIVRHKTWKHI